MAKITFKGNTVQVAGNLPDAGADAPDFRLVDASLGEVSLADYAGKRKVLNIFPSIDTPVCAISVRKFNEYAATHAGTMMLMVSADLPFAHSRFCGDENLKNVVTLSTMRDPAFAENYGVLIEDGKLAGLCARACVVLDENNKVLHAELVHDIAREPDYEAALKVLGA